MKQLGPKCWHVGSTELQPKRSETHCIELEQAGTQTTGLTRWLQHWSSSQDSMNFYRWFSLLQNQDTHSIAHLPPSNSRSCNVSVSKCSVATHDTSALKIQRGFLIPFGKSEIWLESKAATATEISSLTLYLISSQVLRKHQGVKPQQRHAGLIHSRQQHHNAGFRPSVNGHLPCCLL